MAEKLLYLQNGVYKRKEITNGIMTYNNNSFSSVAPTKNGSFYIKLDENGMSFEEKVDAPAQPLVEERYVTLDELVQIGIFLIALIGLVIKICFINKK